MSNAKSGFILKTLSGFLVAVLAMMATWWGMSGVAGVPTPSEWLRMKPGSVKCHACGTISETARCTSCGTLNSPPLIP